MKKRFPAITGILVAAGVGTRMNSTIPKQYCTINTKTLLEYSANILLSQPCIYQLIVVINNEDRLFYRLPISFDPRIHVAIGGKTRTDSVMSALCCMCSKKYSEWVIIHDAVRPCVHHNDLIRLLQNTLFSSYVGGILAAPVRDTIKQEYFNTKIISCTIERRNLWHAFTPQVFKFDVLKSCLSRVLNQGVFFTDEASVLEYFGYHLLLVPGRVDNIKVTYQEDFDLAELYLLHRNKNKL